MFLDFFKHYFDYYSIAEQDYIHGYKLGLYLVENSKAPMILNNFYYGTNLDIRKQSFYYVIESLRHREMSLRNVWDSWTFL